MCESTDYASFPITYKRRSIKLDPIHFYIRRKILLEAIEDVQVSFDCQIVQDTAESAILEVAAYVSGRKNNYITVDVKYPTNWWEAFKEYWFPKFLLKYWPVKYNRIYIHEPQFVICPHFPTESREIHYEYIERVANQ